MKMLFPALLSSVAITFFLISDYKQLYGNYWRPGSCAPFQTLHGFHPVHQRSSMWRSFNQTSWVLTAAHCQEIPQEYTRVVLGAHSLSKGGKEEQIFTVKRMIPHDLYDSKLITNDIMLIELNGTATLNKFVNILGLPNNGKDVERGVSCNVAGWGVTKPEAMSSSDTLQQVNVTVIDRDMCSMYYTYYPAITDDVLCAGDQEEGRDSCSGDSGGPLLCNGKFNGIVSFGCGCGNPHKPGVYTRLSQNYLSWIKRTIQS